MSLSYLIRKFYYTSKFYFFFCMTQILFSLLLIMYICFDIKNNLRKLPVICCEYISNFYFLLPFFALNIFWKLSLFGDIFRNESNNFNLMRGLKMLLSVLINFYRSTMFKNLLYTHIQLWDIASKEDREMASPFILSINNWVCGMMVMDIAMFIKLHGLKCETVFLMELVTVIVYIFIFAYMNIKGFKQIDEDVEFVLMCLRLTLQFFRLIFAIIRASNVKKHRNVHNVHDIDIEAASKSTTSEIHTHRREMIDI